MTTVSVLFEHTSTSNISNHYRGCILLNKKSEFITIHNWLNDVQQKGGDIENIGKLIYFWRDIGTKFRSISTDSHGLAAKI